MERVQGNAVVRVVARPKFEHHDMVAIEWCDRPMWMARNVGSALGYVLPDAVVKAIATDWSDDLVDGTDYTVLRGADLAALKAAVPDLVDRRAPSLMLLTESGVNLVAILSRQPKSRALRRWLAAEVMPSIRRTGGYGPRDVPAPPVDLDQARIAVLRVLLDRRDLVPAEMIKRAGALLDVGGPPVYQGCPRCDDPRTRVVKLVALDLAPGERRFPRRKQLAGPTG